MATYKSFAIVGYGFVASKFLAAFAQKKSEGKIKSLVVLSRSVRQVPLIRNVFIQTNAFIDRKKHVKRLLVMALNCV